MNNETYLSLPIETEKEIKSFFNVKSKLIVFDIGSCDALDSIKYSRLLPNAQIFAFEPLSKNINLIQSNILKYSTGNISIFQKALSNTKGFADFYVSEGTPKELETSDWDFGNKSSSLLPPDKTKETHDWLQFNTVENVETDTLDNFCKNASISSIDYIHMDVQGAELLVLEGAGNMISKIKMIWLEVENITLYKDQPLKNDIEQFMTKNGFTKIKDTVNSIAGDQLWVNYKYFFRKNITHLAWEAYSKISFKKAKKFIESPELYQKISYSQSGEDLIIDFILKARGIEKFSYVDIGANHPYKINNTFLFYKNGNIGINIEPNPSLHKLFTQLRPNDINLNIGINNENTILEYYFFNESSLNTFSIDERDNNINQGYNVIKSEKINVFNINDILSEYTQKSPDVIFIDVEGLDYQIISSINFEKYSPNIFCVETISFDLKGKGIKNDKLISFIKDKGYILYADTNINSIFVKKDFWVL